MGKQAPGPRNSRPGVFWRLGACSALGGVLGGALGIPGGQEGGQLGVGVFGVQQGQGQEEGEVKLREQSFLHQAVAGPGPVGGVQGVQGEPVAQVEAIAEEVPQLVLPGVSALGEGGAQILGQTLGQGIGLGLVVLQAGAEEGLPFGAGVLQQGAVEEVLVGGV